MPKTLLLADDSVTIQKVVGISFANEDITLVTVDNGEDALSRIRRSPPDVVLADVVMPRKNGYEVCEALKQDPALRHIPVLLLTGTFEAFDEQRAQAVGAAGHITKPFEAQTLVDMVNALLAAPAPKASPASSEDSPAPTDALEADAHDDLPAAVGPPSAPSLDSADDAFDFFDDDLDSGLAPGDQAESVERETTAFSLEQGESAFDFAPLVDEAEIDASPSGQPTTIVHPERETPPIPSGDQTVAMLPDSPYSSESSSDDADLCFGDAPADEDAASFAGPSDHSEEVGDEFEERFEFGFDDSPTAQGASSAHRSDPLADLETEEIRSEGGLDLGTPGAFDVSASDLGEPLEAPAESPIGEIPRALEIPEPEEAPLAAATRIELDEPELALTDPEVPFAVRVDSEESAGEPDAAEVRDLSPIQRQRIHEAIEKIAWEAFADVSERIVREAITRVETIAWEVIPQMAEALIREEIRKLKGEPEHD